MAASWRTVKASWRTVKASRRTCEANKSKVQAIITCERWRHQDELRRTNAGIMIDGDRVVVDDIFNNDGVSSSLHLPMLISTKSKCVPRESAEAVWWTRASRICRGASRDLLRTQQPRWKHKQSCDQV